MAEFKEPHRWEKGDLISSERLNIYTDNDIFFHENAVLRPAQTNDIADSAITTSKIADTAVTTNKIADGAVTTAKIADSAVTTNKIADSAITTSKIADTAVTTNKIADGAVTGKASAYSLSSVNFTSETDLASVNITTTGGPVLILISGAYSSSVAGDIIQFRIYRGSTVLVAKLLYADVANYREDFSLIFFDSPAAGSYTYKLTGQRLSGSGTETVYDRVLVVIELKR